MATLQEQRRQAEAAQTAEQRRRDAERDLQALAVGAQRRARLAEQVLMDRAVAQAAATHPSDGQTEPLVAVCWQRDGNANIAGRPIEGKAGELQLLPAGHAQVLVDADAAVIREPLTLPPWQRPAVAGELREVAAELQAAADDLDPPAQQQQGV